MYLLNVDFFIYSGKSCVITSLLVISWMVVTTFLILSRLFDTLSKSISLNVFIALFIGINTVNAVPKVDSTKKVYDYAERLTDDEEQKLKQQMKLKPKQK